MGHIVLLLFSFFTEAVVLWQYASSLFTSSYSSKIRLALLSALYTILFLLSLLEQTGLNVVSFFVFNTVFLYMLFKLKLLLALFHSAILTAIMGISGDYIKIFSAFSLRNRCRTYFLYGFQQNFLFCSHLFINSSVQRKKIKSGTVRSLRTSFNVNSGFVYFYNFYFCSNG